jgi:hypothetical protein
VTAIADNLLIEHLRNSIEITNNKSNIALRTPLWLLARGKLARAQIKAPQLPHIKTAPKEKRRLISEMSFLLHTAKS